MTHSRIHKTKKQFTNGMNGGKFIDKGGFGCVVTPALPCNQTKNKYINNISKHSTSILENSVSKIIRNPDDNTVINEIKISTILRNLDPKHKYFITFDNHCVITEIPPNRTDVINVKYKDDKQLEFSIDTTSTDSMSDILKKTKNLKTPKHHNHNATSKTKTHKYKKNKKYDKLCDIDMNMNPINMIMPFAGISLSAVMKTERNGKTIQSKMHQIFIDNLRVYFKHLLNGLVQMHDNRIVNKDIKQKNIMLNFIQDTMIIRYIDFGLSEYLTSSICSSYANIHLKGTFRYIAPEIFISYIIAKYHEHTQSYKLTKIGIYISSNVKKSLILIGERSMLDELDENIDILYKRIESQYRHKSLLGAYFGSSVNKFNGYLQKADVYALGLSIYDTLSVHSDINVKKNTDLYNLLRKMMHILPSERYNALQCLAHPYFTKG